MATSFFGLHVEPVTMVRGLASALGIFQVAIGVRGIMAPSAYAEQFGFAAPHPVSLTSHTNPFIKATSGRNVSAGLAVLACVYFGQEKAIGLMWATGIITGLVDGLSVMDLACEPNLSLSGEEKKKDQQRVIAAQGAAYGHIALTALFSAIGIWIAMSL